MRNCICCVMYCVCIQDCVKNITTAAIWNWVSPIWLHLQLAAVYYCYCGSHFEIGSVLWLHLQLVAVYYLCRHNVIKWYCPVSNLNFSQCSGWQILCIISILVMQLSCLHTSNPLFVTYTSWEQFSGFSSLIPFSKCSNSSALVVVG